MQVDRDPNAIFLRHIETAIEIWLDRLADQGEESLAAANREKENLYQLLQHGLYLPDTVPLSANVALQAFELVERGGYWQEWLDLLQRAEAGLTEKDRELHVLILNRMGQIKRLQNHIDDAIGYSQRALKIANELHQPRLIALSQYNLAETALKGRLFDRIDGPGEAALKYFERQPNEHRLTASLLNTLGESARRQARFEEACRHLEMAVALAARRKIPFLEARFRSNFALALNSLGRPEEAIAEIDRAMDLLQGSLNLFDRITLHLNKGFIRAGQSRWTEAVAAFRQVDLAYLAQRQNTFLLALTNTNLGFSLLMIDRPDTAEPYLNDAVAHWRSYGDQVNLANAIGCLGKLHRARGELEQARARFKEALDVLKPINQDPTAASYTAEFNGYLRELNA